MHLIVFVAIAALVAAQQNIQDPVTNFCRRHQHQTCVIDSKLYIDGGLVYYGTGVNNDSVPQKNTWLLWEDLSEIKSTNADFPSQHSNLTKGSDVPTVSGGVLWPDQANKLFYLFGGEYNNASAQSFTSLWFYDTIYNTWNRSKPDGGEAQISWPAFGASTIDDKGIAYYYGGYLNNKTVSGWNGDALMLNSLVSFDMNLQKWSNLSDATPRAEGTLQYIPASDRGMLVYFGGVETNLTGNVQYANMSIRVFDIASNRWYTQSATGDIPQSRSGFCASAIAAADSSSYNIYVFGGMDNKGKALGDLYILSLPSFEWISWYPNPQRTNFTGGKAWASCNVINHSQMIIMSGKYTNASQVECDSQKVGGQHGLLLGQESIEQGNLWHRIMPDVSGYRVPQNITKVIGGGTDGKATVTAPVHGWATSDLAIYFKSTYSPTARTASRPIPTESTPSASLNPVSDDGRRKNTGAKIGGAVVGSIVGLIIVTVATCFCLRAHRRRKATKSQNDAHSMCTCDHSAAATKFTGFNHDSPGGFSYSSNTPRLPYSTYDSPGSERLRIDTFQYGRIPIFVENTDRQTYYPPPPDPSQSPQSAYTFRSELPGISTPIDPRELPDTRSPVPVRAVSKTNSGFD